jgi:hypothetical protein
MSNKPNTNVGSFEWSNERAIVSNQLIIEWSFYNECCRTEVVLWFDAESTPRRNRKALTRTR